VEPAVGEVEADARRRRRWGKWRRQRGSGGGGEVEADARWRKGGRRARVNMEERRENTRV
jgi:hypothetical protein